MHSIPLSRSLLPLAPLPLALSLCSKRSLDVVGMDVRSKDSGHCTPITRHRACTRGWPLCWEGLHSRWLRRRWTTRTRPTPSLHSSKSSGACRPSSASRPQRSASCARRRPPSAPPSSAATPSSSNLCTPDLAFCCGWAWMLCWMVWPAYGCCLELVHACINPRTHQPTQAPLPC